MKNYFYLILSLLFIPLLGIKATTEINVTTAGGLQTALGDGYMTITDLKVSGTLNADDVKTLRLMAGGNESGGATTSGALTTLDLSGASFSGDGTYVTAETLTPTLVGGNTTISTLMFYNCPRLVTVTLPSTVTTVQQGAFQNCSNLTTINPQPSAITTVGVKAFQNCTSLNSINLSTITSFGEFSFDNCGALGAVTLNASVTLLNRQTFHNCVNLTLTNMVLPATLTSMGDEVFYNCNKLTEITLPQNSSYTAISTGLLSECDNLTTVNIPSSVTEVGYRAFQNSTKLSTLNFYNVTDKTQTGTANNNVTKVIGCAFDNCNALSAASFEGFTKVTHVGDRGFEGCVNLTDQELANILTHLTEGESYNEPTSTLTNTISCMAFNGCSAITSVTIPNSITTINDKAFESCSNLAKLDLGTGVTTLGNLVFKNDTKLTSVTVQTATAPTCPTDNDINNPFMNVPANQCTVAFSTTAADAYVVGATTGYMSYRNTPAFMYLLTKTMDEDNIDYTVVPQRHADVVLHRTFKAGWNTLALPFGSATDANKTTDCAEIFQNALKGKGTGTSDFMIAAYRGLNKTTNTFYFLKYDDVTIYPLDEFEPLLIKMGAGDIASDNKYTFTNVEVNYDANGNKEYTAAETKSLIGKLAGTNSKYVDGSYNHDANTKFGACTYTDFYFTGTLYMQSSKAEATATVKDFIQAGDYIIQNNNFYKAVSGSTYGLKGFRGWFKQFKPTAAGAKASTLSIDVVDDSGATTDIVKMNADGEEVKDAKVYNINGQLVGTSLNGLNKGLYIVNGKKYVVK